MLPSGQAVANFSLATTESWKNAQGERQSKTEWHQISIFGKLAETAEKWLRKGQSLMVEGRINYREYTDQQGVKKTATTIRCDNFVMLGSKDSNKGGGDSDRHQDSPSEPSGGGGYDDDIPF